MNYGLYALIIVLIAWMLYKRFVPVKGMRNLNLQQFKSEYKGHKLVDVREVQEFKQGHIAGAVNIPLSQIERRLNEIQKDESVYLYCRSGMRSKQAAKLLSKHGYNQISQLNGGISVWDGPTTKK
ncbi:MAG TPA: rhodanese-like domain-containing protein [Paenibacillus sp.]|jgi:rhodanese-related sulfurtransferase